MKNMKKNMRLLASFGVCILIFFLSPSTFAQRTILKSSVDDSISIKTITVAPVIDNVSQIYSKPLTSQLRNIVEADRQWNLRSFPDSIKTTPEEFEDNPEAVKAALKKAGTDALLSTRLTKSPNGIQLKLNLFLATDGFLLAQENLQDYPGFEISDLRGQLEVLYKKIKSSLPYAGTILSRKNQIVTLNLGTQQGLKEGYILSVVQIVKLNRHPRFRFVVSAEKEIIGRIVINKSEESLSFGSIEMERSEGVIQPGMKVVPVNFVTYTVAPTTPEGKILDDMAGRKDAPVMLGDSKPREWVPASAPSLGKFGLMLGMGDYSVNNTLTSVGAVSSGQMPTPSIHFNGELWLTKNWLMDVGLSQYVLSLANTYSGSTPGNISVASSKMNLHVGYNFLIQEDFWGPKFQVLGGYSKFASTVDTSSPVAFTSLDFYGMSFGLGGSLPVSQEYPLTLGARLMYHFNPTVSESPVTSGSSSSATVISFSGNGTYRWSEHMNLRGEMQYDLYSASFSGTGSRSPRASSASHTLTTFAGGIEYLF